MLSRLGGPAGEGAARCPAPAGVVVIEDDAVPANNSAMKRLLRMPRSELPEVK